MSQVDLIFFVIKLVLGGLVAFLAILLWSKTGDPAWMSMIAGIVVSYAGIVYDLLVTVGILTVDKLKFMGLPLTSLLFTAVPYVFFIIAFILMIVRASKRS